MFHDPCPMSTMLSIVILNYRSAGLVKYCLRGIAAHPPSCPYEIIVVDNASRDAALGPVESAHPNVRFVPLAANRGYAAGNNAGLAASTGEYVLILNPDIVLFKDSINQLIQALERNEQIGMVGPKLLNPDRSLQYSCNRFYSPLTPLARRTVFGRSARGAELLRQDLMMDWDHASERDVDWLMGSAVLVRRKALEQVGSLDERFFLYFEDMDWCRRFWAQQWGVRYIPQSVMVHFHQRLSAQSLWKRHTRIHIASAIKYFMKHGTQPAMASRGSAV